MTSRAHITAFHAENVKRLRVVRLEPGAGGGLIEVSGANGSGKSSVLDAIAFAILGRGEVDPKPIRAGAESAIVRLTLGDVVVTRKFSPNGGSTLTIESADGARFPSPQRMLDELVGDSVLGFDPLAFDRMKPRDQLEEVRKVAPLPPEVDQWRADVSRLYEERTAVNRRAKDAEAALRSAPPVGDRPPAVPDLAVMLARLSAAHEANRARDARASAVIHMQEKAARLWERAQALREEIARVEEEARDVEASTRDMPAIGARVDTAAIEREITEAREAERIAREWRAANVYREQAATLEAESSRLTLNMSALEERIREAVAAAPMPVPGLTYGAEGLEFNGVPLQQASGAERLRVALGLAMAQRPGLRVVRIKDGSLLDAESLAIVADMAAREDFQVWIERVDTTGRVGIVLEDGEVKTINGRGAPHDEA